MDKSYFITAIGTPLNDDETLCVEGLKLQIAEQTAKGFEGILVAGSMGCMQLLTDETYRLLIETSVKNFDGEIMVGASDCGYARAAAKIDYVNNFKVDGVAILAPYFWGLSQGELVDYYKALADVSKAPIYIYDLPQVVGTKISMETCLELAKHPNIAGAKLSCTLDFSRKLYDTVGEKFRIIVAQPDLVDAVLKFGIKNQLDGMWTLTPGWTLKMRQAVEIGDWDTAADYTRKVTAVRDLLPKYGWASFTNIMNARGLFGDYVGRPFKRLTEQQNEQLLNEPIMKELVAEDSFSA